MASPRGLRERDVTRRFRGRELPKAVSPAPHLDLKGHDDERWVRRVAVLPGSGNVATAGDDGRVRVYRARGDGCPLVDIPAHRRRVSALAVLDEHVLASASMKDRKLHAWDARTGEYVHTIDVRGKGVLAMAAAGPEMLVAAVRPDALVFFQHARGRQLAEVARLASPHLKRISDIACHENVMVTASRDKTARVWSVSTRQPRAVLRGHRDWVVCAAVNSKYIATGTRDETLRLFANDADFSLVSVLRGVHSNFICRVQFIGPDLLLSGSYDRTICFTAVSPDARPIARVRTRSGVSDTAVTADGQIAWAGARGIARVSAPPLAVADAAKEHAVATCGSVSSSAAGLQQQDAPPPLQAALVDVQAGVITAGEACRTLLNAERCSASVSEWWCGHQLLMLAVRQGEVAGECGLEVEGKVEHNYWFKNLYLPAKAAAFRTKNLEKVEACLEEAKTAGVIEGTQAILGLIEV